MKIVFFINSMAGGGAERVVSTLGNFLCKDKNADIHILTIHSSECMYELHDSISVQQLTTGSLCRGVGKFIFIPFVALELFIKLKKIRPDATLSLLVRANLIHVLTKWLGNKSCVYLSERVDSEAHYSGLSGLIIKFFIRLLYSKADSIIAISEGVKQGLENIGVPQENIITIHNPQDIDFIKSKSKEVCNIALPKDVPILVTIGRLDFQKDYRTLLDTVKKVKVKKKIHLIIIGEGPLEGELKSYAEQQGLMDLVSWIGWQDNPFSIMSKSDCFVFSSRYEGFGNVLVEAMACGLPIITTDCPSGPKEIVENGKFGILVPVGDSNAMAREIIELFQYKEKYAEYKKLSEIRAESFNVERIVIKYLEVLGI